MPAAVYDTTAPKRAVNVSLNSDLVAKAKALGLNLSEAFEARLAELVAEGEGEKWRRENAEAIRAYNERIENSMMLSDLMWPQQ
jgi:antitoxin CcdA